MSITIKPSCLTGKVFAPPSKSMTHRYLIISALANGLSRLRNPLTSDDTLATVEGLRKLGIKIKEVEGDWEIHGGKINSPNTIINCRESGTTLRLLTGLCSLLDQTCTLSGAPSLLRRPNKPLLDALEQMGVSTESDGGYPPISVTGRMRGGRAEIPGNISSQFISSIILAAPYSEKPVELKVSNQLESKPYVRMTIDAMRKSGIEVWQSENLNYMRVPISKYTPQTATIEGDWSSAAYMLAAGTLAGKVHVDKLNLASYQADKEIICILDRMGAYIKINGNRVTTEKSKYIAVNADLSDCPDLFPIIACLCSVAEGTSRLTGLKRLRIKESDRLAAMMEGLKKMGIEIIREDDTVSITGGSPSGAVIDPHNDHRIAMSFAILAQIATGETSIMNPECVSKSYPGFWEDLRKIGAKIR